MTGLPVYCMQISKLQKIELIIVDRYCAFACSWILLSLGLARPREIWWHSGALAAEDSVLPGETGLYRGNFFQPDMAFITNFNDGCI